LNTFIFSPETGNQQFPGILGCKKIKTNHIALQVLFPNIIIDPNAAVKEKIAAVPSASQASLFLGKAKSPTRILTTFYPRGEWPSHGKS
jgi:hypothetical protein